MLFQPEIKPGINKDDTRTQAAGQYIDGNRVRFFKGVPEKIGGWQKLLTTAFDGVCRLLFSWAALDGGKYFAALTNRRAYVYFGGTTYDITPARGTGSLTDPFETTAGSDSVVVNDTDHGLSVDDIIEFSGASAVGGLTIDGEYTVTTVVNANKYTLTAASTASSTASGGGTVAFTYLLPVGPVGGLLGLGWGAGTWGFSTWGTPRTGLTPSSLAPRLWTADDYGEDLIICPRGGSIYLWDKSAGTSTRAAIVSGAPTENLTILVSSPTRHLIAFGSIDYSSSTFDSMLVRWTSREDPTDWTPTATSTAGSQRIQGGSEIRIALQGRGEILIWTDTDLHSMQYVGGILVFGFQPIATNCGLIGPNAAIVVNGVGYWMGYGGFFRYDGQVTSIETTLWSHVFNNLTASQQFKITVGHNAQFHEIIWFYPSESATENDSAVTYNYVNGAWSIWEISRTAWMDRGLFQYPLATDASAAGPDSYVYQHEVLDCYDDDGSAMGDYIVTADFRLGTGDQFAFMRRVIPDATQTGEMQVTIYTRKYQQATTQNTSGPHTVGEDTRKVSMRARGRLAAYRIESVGTGSYWRLGAIQFDVQPDGER